MFIKIYLYTGLKCWVHSLTKKSDKYYFQNKCFNSLGSLVFYLTVTECSWKISFIHRTWQSLLVDDPVTQPVRREPCTAHSYDAWITHARWIAAPGAGFELLRTPPRLPLPALLISAYCRLPNHAQWRGKGTNVTLVDIIRSMRPIVLSNGLYQYVRLVFLSW